MKQYKYLFFIAFSLGCKSQVKEEIYLLPNKFIGNIIIIYHQTNGKPDSINEDKFIYKVPATGILYLKGAQHLQDMRQMNYYYYNKAGFKSRLCRLGLDSLSDCDGIIYNNRSESYGWSYAKNQYSYSIITVGTKDSIPKAFDPRVFFK